MVGELVLPEVIDGITEASITRKPAIPIDAQARIDHRAHIVAAAHLGGADGMEDRVPICRRLDQSASSSSPPAGRANIRPANISATPAAPRSGA